MAYQDLLLSALTYPDATPDRAIRSGVALAKRLGGGLTLLTVRIDIPKINNPLANALIGLDQLARQEEARSAATAQLEAVCARIAAETTGIEIDTLSVVASPVGQAGAVAAAARTRDLTLVSIGPAVLADGDLAETVLFGSGRPILVYPEAQEVAPADGFATVAVAWDGSARAARAVADALPILHRAGSVRVFVAVDEKPETGAGAAADLVRHLKCHGLDVTVDERRSEGPIGRRLTDYVAEVRPDLLVMGGFGHARLREFMLGGATQAVLEAPPCPVLMSH